MRYYLDNLSSPINFTSQGLECEIEHIKKILAKDGEYRINQNKLYKYTFIKQDDDLSIPGYIENYTLLYSDNERQCSENLYQIPYNHKEYIIKLCKYKLHPKSQTIFIIEKFNNKISDFYFESSYEAEDKSLKEDIISFLSYIK